MVVRVNTYRICMSMTALLGLAWVIFLLMHGQSGLSSRKNQKIPDTHHCLQNTSNWLFTKNKMIEIARAVHKAQIHVRGSKTSDFLRKALNEMDFVFDAFQIDRKTIFKRTVLKSRNVCPEMYMGPKYDLPFFEKGFEETDCDYGKPIQDLVTIVAIDYSADSDISKQGKDLNLIKSILDVYTNISVLLHTQQRTKFANILRDYPSLLLVESNADKVGSILNKLISKVSTPYVLIAKDLDFLTPDSRLIRLVREIERMNVGVAGGAWRDHTGRWTHGCYQTAYKNSTLTFVYGYDESLHSCLFCDYITGPFVSKKDILTKNTFRPYDITDGLFEEWFLRVKLLKIEAISCPDSMFFVREVTTQNNYKMFMNDYKIFKLLDTNGRMVFGKCPERPSRYRTKALSPCLLNDNSKVVKFIMRACSNSGVVCEVLTGNSLGAIKFGKVLPWERDGDIGFLSNNLTALLKLKTQFEKEKYRFEIVDATENRGKHAKINVHTSSWRIELFGPGMLDSNILLAKGLIPTKALLDGQWVNVARNPGLVARNRYGQEIYQHALHWIDTNAPDSWAPYTPTRFPSCKTYKLFYNDHHDCLDRYNHDGSLQFIYVLP